MTKLRFFGLRASEAALVSLSDLLRIREGHAKEMDVMQPKTGCFRKVLVPESLVHVLSFCRAFVGSVYIAAICKERRHLLLRGLCQRGNTRLLKGKTRLGHVVEWLPQVCL